MSEPDALVPAENAGPPIAPDPVLAMIERAARDPAVDLAKLEGLMALRERNEAQRASVAFADALVELGADMPAIDRTGKIVVYSKIDREKPGGVPAGATPIQSTLYATFDDILEALRPVLYKHGFSLRFEHEATANGLLATAAILRHRLGHEERATTPPLKHDASGSKNDTQAVGSSLTYGRRYALMALLPIVSHAPEDSDDDGAAAGGATIDPDQIAHIEQQIRDTGSDMAKFLVALGAEAAESLTVKQYQRGLALIAEKKKRTGRP
jgi:ERF superfamily